MRVVPFSLELESQVIGLIVGIQRGEFGIDITAEQQPDLSTIPSFYQTGAGNFWVALVDDRVIGTISLLDIGERQSALRKMFVHPDFRGRALGTARSLLDTLLAWAGDRDTREIFLGTTPFFLAAHRFYEKHGFSEIPKSQLPTSFPIMEVDTRFYHLHLPDHAVDESSGLRSCPT
jgi:N-acetylglutamate synthase-like GNAT family acetyltransferase